MADRAPRILLADDEQAIQTLLSYPLQKDGYEVVRASDGREALARFSEQPFDLVVLDVMMPRLDGLEVCRRLRSRSSVPIIMLTAKTEEIDKVLGLELGADDYITKPFSVREVLARVNAVLRRASPDGTEPNAVPERDAFGDFAIDRPARRVIWRGADVKLTTREFDLLSYLLAHPGRVHTRDVLLENVWGHEFSGDRKTVDVHVRWLREKFAGVAPFEIVTVRGVGYRLDRTLSAELPA